VLHRYATWAAQLGKKTLVAYHLAPTADATIDSVKSQFVNAVNGMAHELHTIGLRGVAGAWSLITTPGIHFVRCSCFVCIKKETGSDDTIFTGTLTNSKWSNIAEKKWGQAWKTWGALEKVLCFFFPTQKHVR
jgi:hypothetical protein